MKVDAIKEWARHLVTVGRDAVTTAPTIRLLVAKIATRAGIHGSNKLKAGRKVRVHAGTRNCEGTCLHGFAQNLENIAIELGQLIEKQHSIVGPGHLARRERRSTTDECRCRK